MLKQEAGATTGKETPSAKADGFQKRIDTLDTAMAGAAAGYEEARTEMAAHHVKMDKRLQQIRGRIAMLRPVVERFIAGTVEPSDDVLAKCHRYLELCAEFGNALQARRICYGATVPPGEQDLGKPISGRGIDGATVPAPGAANKEEQP